MTRLRLSQFIFVLPFMLAGTRSTSASLDVLYEWKYIDYVWDNETQKETAIDAGQYDYTKIITNDVQQLPDGRVLITTPKYYDNPASLSTVSDTSGDGGPLLVPYPNSTWHKPNGDCTGITSVNRVRVDKCNRLWVVDSGKIGNKQVCPAQIFVFNATTDELIEQVEIPTDLTHNPNNSSMGRCEIQVVETEGDSCERTWAYIGDPEGWGLVIYNGSSIWRLNDEVYAPDDGESLFTLNGENVTINNGVASMLLPPEGFVHEDYVLFKPMASVKGYAASREEIHNSYSGLNVTYYMSNYSIPSQELARDYSSDGVLIAGLPTQTAIACWNLEYPLVDPYVVILEENVERLQFVSGLKITKGLMNGVKDENVWVMSNRLQQFISGTMDFTDYNFRVLGANVAALVNGTNCQAGPHPVTDTIEDKFFFECSELYNGYAHKSV